MIRQLIERALNSVGFTWWGNDPEVKRKLVRKPGVWIRNIKEGNIHADGHGADCGGAEGAICITCEKKMTGIWDTVCYACGGTSCYDHSMVLDKEIDGTGHWFCVRCASHKKKKLS